MTKLREPLSFSAAIHAAVDLLGWTEAARLTRRAARTVRHWTESDRKGLPTLDRAIALDRPLFREVYYHCRNPDACGHHFVCEMVAVRTTRASSFPAPLHTLPMSTWHGVPANDDPANDNGPLPEAVADAVPT